MSKYDALWKYVQAQAVSPFTMTFDEIHTAAGIPLDHSFLQYKKELEPLGWKVGKISLKAQTVVFEKRAEKTEDDIPELLMHLEAGDTATAYHALLAMEKLSDDSGALYPYAARFAEMVKSERYAVRVRGFRLLCKQAKWDTENRLDAEIIAALSILRDEKPTAVRQALAALRDVVRAKPNLRAAVCDAAAAIDSAEYKDSMRGLIEKDVRALLAACEL